MRTSDIVKISKDIDMNDSRVINWRSLGKSLPSIRQYLYKDVNTESMRIRTLRQGNALLLWKVRRDNG